APQLPAVGKRVRRRPGDEPGLEQLRMERMIGAPGRDVDRDVADQPDPAIARVLPQPGPLSFEPDLVGHRGPSREALPVADPRSVTLAEVEQLRRADGGPPVLEQARPRRE